MVAALISMVVDVAMILVALWANRRLRSEDYLPMQWLLRGQVTWSAPRPIALAFLPAFAFLTFAGLTSLSIYVRPRSGQEGDVVPAVLAIGIILLGVQLLHLWMIGRTLRRNGR